jgi:tetratricopeptide (TPR) repeat protein
VTLDIYSHDIRPLQYEIRLHLCQLTQVQGDKRHVKAENPDLSVQPFRCYDLRVLRDASQHPTLTVEREAGGAFARKDVCRLLQIENRQLRTWERQKLIPELAVYKFRDLLKLKRLIKLRSEHVHPGQIRKAMQSLEAYLKDSPDLSEDVQVYKDGRRVRIKIGKQKMEPASGQLLFDFDQEELSKLLHLPTSQKNAIKIAERLKNKLEADQWFERGLELEQTGAPYEQIIAAYQRAAELDPKSAGALVNLGTVFFNGHAWSDAEQQYLKAIEIDPAYALAHFNLGNLYDEQNDSENALIHYLEALRLNPHYADVHYNLALLYQGLRDIMSSLRHWRAYLKLDSTTAWAQIARRELKKLEAATVLPGSRPPQAGMYLVKSAKV